MGEAFITRRGGIKEAFAVIAVTYPSGSTCICTRQSDGKQIPAKDDSGSFLFLIPEPQSLPETWTVSCTDGSRTASKTVTISSQYQAKIVSLAYKLWLFKENEGIASGYTSAYFGDPVTFGNTISGGGTFYIAPSSGEIDLSSYHTLFVEMQRAVTLADYPFGLGEIPTGDGFYDQGEWLAKYDDTRSAYPDRTTLSLDIPDGASSAGCFKVYSGNNYDDNVYYNVWLE